MKNLIIILVLFWVWESKADEVLSQGNKKTDVVIKVFSSLTCPYCSKFHLEVFENLKKEYIDKGKVRFEHHSFPLDLAALNADKIVRCTSENIKSFELLSELYKAQNEWAVGSDINKINDNIKKIGKNLGLNESAMNKCLEDDELQDRILNERINAQKNYKISSTPTIYINDKKYEKKYNYKSLKKAIEKLL